MIICDQVTTEQFFIMMTKYRQPTVSALYLFFRFVLFLFVCLFVCLFSSYSNHATCFFDGRTPSNYKFASTIDFVHMRQCVCLRFADGLSLMRKLVRITGAEAVHLTEPHPI